MSSQPEDRSRTGTTLLGFEQPDGSRDWVPGEQRSGLLRSRFPSPHLPRWSRLGLGTRRPWPERAIKTLTKRGADSPEGPRELRSLDWTLSLSRVGEATSWGGWGEHLWRSRSPVSLRVFSASRRAESPAGPGAYRREGGRSAFPKLGLREGWGPAVSAVTRAGGAVSDWRGGRRRGRRGGGRRRRWRCQEQRGGE